MAEGRDDEGGHGGEKPKRVASRGRKRDPEEDSERYQKWCKDRADKHVRTSLYHQVLTKLREKKSVLLLADAGDGKSTLLQLVAIQFGEDGFLTLEIDTPADINNYNIDGKNVLFVCDNLLGETNINEHKTQVWKNSRRKQFSGHVKFLFACRIEFWEKNKTDLKRKDIFNEIIVVRSDKLTLEDKEKTLDQHLGDKISPDIKRRIAMNSIFAFPESCRIVSHVSNIDFSDTTKLVEMFSNPFMVVLKQMETMEENNKLQYAALLFCLLNGRKFPSTGTPDIVKQPNFEVVRELYLSDSTCSVKQLYDTLLDNVKELDGWMLTLQGDYYTFYHDGIFETMCRFHGDRYPHHILTFCEPEVVFSVFTTNQYCGSDVDRVTLPPDCYPQLVEIVTTECVKGSRLADSEMWRFVFGRMNAADILREWSVLLKRKTVSFINRIAERLFSRKYREPTMFDVLKTLTELPDCDLTVRDVFECAAYHGDLQTSTLALESGVNSDDRVAGLMSAAEQGHSNIVTMTVQRTDPDIQNISYIEELCEAVSSVRVERVVEMMMSQPDMDSDIKHMVLRWAVWRGHTDVVRVIAEQREMDNEVIACGLTGAVVFDNLACLREILRLLPDIDPDIIHMILELAIRDGKVRIVRELLKRPDIRKRAIQDWLDKDNGFFLGTEERDRDRTRAVLLKYVNTVHFQFDTYMVRSELN